MHLRSFDQNSRPSVNITLDGPGSKDLPSTTTEDNIGKLMAVLLLSKSEGKSY